MPAIPLLALFPILLAGPAAAPEPSTSAAVTVSVPDAGSSATEDVRTRTYTIRGATAPQLQDQMRRLGPQDPQGDRTYGDTVWNLTYAYQTVLGPAGYSIASVQLQPEITLVLPQWTPPAHTPAALIAQWRRFRSALLVHEHGHVLHARNAIAEIRRALTDLSTYPTAAALSTAVQETVDRITARYRDLDIRYDRDTRHGATQGAMFPQP